MRPSESGYNPSSERKSLVEKRMEMIALILMKRNGGEKKKKDLGDVSARHS
ncbi:hypothetical protein ACFQZE_12790 [Paenibacillus sp. GCM10027627]